MNTLLTISQAAKLLGKSISTLRRWEGEGKISSIREDESKHRRYRKEDLIDFATHDENEIPKLEAKINTIIFDFDSTLFPQESLDGVLAQVMENDPELEAKKILMNKICDQGMEGQINLEESINQRLKLAKIHRRDIETYVQSHLCTIEPWMRKSIKLLQDEGQVVIVISGGFEEWIEPIVAELGIEKEHVFANRFLFNSKGYATENLSSPLISSTGKIDVIRSLKEAGIVEGTTFFTGDGISDLRVYEAKEVNYFLHMKAYKSREALKGATPYSFGSCKRLYDFLTCLFR